MTVTCNCMRFEKTGILCRHAFYALRVNEVNEIPEKYIPLRWTKDVYTLALAKLQYIQVTSKKSESKSGTVINDMYADLAFCLQVLQGDDKAIEEAKRRHHELIMELTQGRTKGNASKQQVLEHLVGVTQPNDVSILNPIELRNKGCGKRMVSDRDKAIENDSQTKRTCKLCKKQEGHDSRNCPYRFTE